jgi:hypothetical protein
VERIRLWIDFPLASFKHQQNTGHMPPPKTGAVDATITPIEYRKNSQQREWPYREMAMRETIKDLKKP